ncbi:MAG: hypothetical protein N3I35_19480 [Clostridia bacterium]|nr:hypothetical protein [Clostridia bacterium]
MFRRLFISLIILSALTAEGIVNAPWDFYNLCLYVNNQSSLPESADNNQIGLDFTKETAAAFSRTSLENRLFLESGIIEQLKINITFKSILKESYSKSCSGKTTINAEHGLSYPFINSHLTYNPGSEKEIIIKQSDISPPKSAI